ncbi:3-oxoacyl-ACP synthase [Hwangdonia sp.]|uniref:3-oxoacyl-ACP synthase n=1 Tax=Hwangdonia sp. TaxID=1883432 RepID=UPI003AB27340
MNIKEELYNQCVQFVEKRYQTVQHAISEIQESLLSETKSSAGDKHETGRAMLQLEREKAGHQLSEIVKIKKALSKIDTEKSSKTVGLGSVVYSSGANYFMAVSAGQLKVENHLFYAISPNTPIGQLLMGKTVGDTIVFRGVEFNVTSLV